VWDFFMGWPLTFSFLGLVAFYLRQRHRVLTLLLLGLALLTLADQAPTVWFEWMLLILGSVASGLGLYLQWQARKARLAAQG
jgi:hypothetical protein